MCHICRGTSHRTDNWWVSVNPLLHPTIYLSLPRMRTPYERDLLSFLNIMVVVKEFFPVTYMQCNPYPVSHPTDGFRTMCPVRVVSRHPEPKSWPQRASGPYSWYFCKDWRSSNIMSTLLSCLLGKLISSTFLFWRHYHSNTRSGWGVIVVQSTI